MCSAYVAAGLPPDRFWEITPRLYLIEMDGARARIDREFQGLIQQAWLGAALSRAKKLPSLTSLIKDSTKTDATPDSWETQLAKWEAYAARKAN